MPMIEIVLEKDHEELGTLLGTFEEAIKRADFEKALVDLDLFWARLAMHIRAEHLCLFPAILDAPIARFDQTGLPSIEFVTDTIAGLRADHNRFMDQLAKSIAILREVVANTEKETVAPIAEVLEAVAEVKQRLQEHNRIEEELIYQWPSALLSQEQLKQLRLAIKRELENLPPRFAEGKLDTC